MSETRNTRNFTANLLRWHREENDRVLPWKGITDPYKIWLSEIILQQTRAEQGRPYYESFITAYPTVADLAAAQDDAVFRLWQGLGYYNRCRNLLHTARHITAELSGTFPRSHEGLLALKGIGTYTAAAIASFAFGLPHAVIDGNVYRVLARYFGVFTTSDSTEGKKEFAALAQSALDTDEPAAYNQAIMDLGATVCTPLAPRCDVCPLSDGCYALKNGAVGSLPVRAKKAALQNRFLHYILLRKGDSIWLRKRTAGIWSALYEPFLVEADAALERASLAETEALQQLGIPAGNLSFEGSLNRKLTHQNLEIRFFSAAFAGNHSLLQDGIWVTLADIPQYPLPKPVEVFFSKKHYF